MREDGRDHATQLEGDALWDVASDEEADDLPVAERLEDGRPAIDWAVYHQILSTRPETVPQDCDLKLLLEDEQERVAFLLRWLTGWPAVSCEGDLYVMQPGGTLWEWCGPHGRPDGPLHRHPGYRFELAGLKDPHGPGMAALCRDIIRFIGPELRPHLINLPGGPGPSYGQLSYCRAIGEALGVPLPEVIDRGTVASFLKEHKEAFEKDKKAKAAEQAARTRAENIAKRLESGLPARRPVDPLGNHGKKWQPGHEDRLRKLWAAGMPLAEIAAKLRRKEVGVALRLAYLGLISKEELGRMGITLSPKAR